MSDSDLRGKVVVVTGASSGIGRATALECARQGARVVVAARRQQALAALVEECERMGGAALAVALDVGAPTAMDDLAGHAVEALGRIDAWVNNAGLYSVGLFEDTPDDVFERIVQVNLMGVVRGSRAALRQFRTQEAGVIVNVSSMIGGLAGPYVSAYATSKWAVRGFSFALHEELRADPHIHVCVVRPSSVDTPIFRLSANFSGRRIKALTPLYQPEQAAGTIVGLIERPRREAIIGRSGQALALARHAAPALVDRIFARRAVRDQFDGDEKAEDTPGNLFEPDDRWASVSGGWAEEEEASGDAYSRPDR
jgi:NAD(P)-dependent dehydrogenase (short-subunit alcohol dehydrogenase family)